MSAMLAGLGAAASLLGNVGNAKFQMAENAMQRNFTLGMYNRQRKDALTDMEFQNNYNSPAAQMARLKAAGLNPNLVYGNGGATQQSAAVRSAQGSGYTGKAPQIDTSGFTQSLIMMYDLQKIQAQTDLLKAQAELAREKTLTEPDNRVLTQARQRGETARTESTWLDMQQRTALAPHQVELLKGQIKQQDANTQYTIDENERKAALQAPTLAKAIQEVANLKVQKLATEVSTEESRERIREIKQRIANLEKDERVKQFDIEARKRGINPGDPGYWRVIKEVLSFIFNP